MENPNKEQIRAIMSYMGKRSALALTPQQRIDRSKKAVAAREVKRAEKKAAG